MGDFMSREEGIFTAGSLNDMFGAQRIAGTFGKIEQLRQTFPRLLNPAHNPGPKAARRQTLRFAAFLLTDEVQFNGNYPAPRFKAWLKWLTWLGTLQDGSVTLNNVNFNGTPSQLMLEVLSQALPPGGNAQPIHFSWTHDSAAAHFAIAGTTNAGFSINIVSGDHSEVHANSDDEDDIDP